VIGGIVGDGCAPPQDLTDRPCCGRGADRVTAVARKLLLAALVLGPLVVVLDYVVGAGDTALFAVAAAALVPLAWLIGEATEHAAEHTGPGIGGFLNASF